MGIVTARIDGSIVRPPFTWSYSKIKNYEICPKRHYAYDIAKSVPTDKSADLDWGDVVHKASAAYFNNGTPLPDPVVPTLQPWITKLLGGSTQGQILAEQKYAFTESFEPCGYFAKNVWFRGIADVVKLAPPVALAVDWKTGKILEDSIQLGLMAQCIFSHYPTIQKVRTEFVWLAHQASSREDFSRADLPVLWQAVLPRLSPLKLSNDTSDYPAKPNHFCASYCKVETCIHFGKRY